MKHIFYLIYDYDLANTADPNEADNMRPKAGGDQWYQTEDDSDYEWDWFALESLVGDRHVKPVGSTTQERIDSLLPTDCRWCDGKITLDDNREWVAAEGTGTPETCSDPAPGEYRWNNLRHMPESDAQYGYLRYLKGYHRKWVIECDEETYRAIMEEMIEEIDPTTLLPTSGEATMGSITEYGCLEAVAINMEPMGWNIGGVTHVLEASCYVSHGVTLDEGETAPEGYEQRESLFAQLAEES